MRAPSTQCNRCIAAMRGKSSSRAMVVRGIRSRHVEQTRGRQAVCMVCPDRCSLHVGRAKATRSQRRYCNNIGQHVIRPAVNRFSANRCTYHFRETHIAKYSHAAAWLKYVRRPADKDLSFLKAGRPSGAVSCLQYYASGAAVTRDQAIGVQTNDSSARMVP